MAAIKLDTTRKYKVLVHDQTVNLVHHGLIPEHCRLSLISKLELRGSIDPLWENTTKLSERREAKVKGCRREIKEVYRLLPIRNTTITEI
jgi:hypothetical protein